jgi:prepilin-type N-terminal cleavage/methylation domain-containing protein
MLNKIRKVLKRKEGFTLIELITVIVVLAIILGIGIPRYAMIQAQSEWDADVSTLKNLEKAAELWYARNPFAKDIATSGNIEIEFGDISGEGQFDPDTILKRKKTSTAGSTDSDRNTAKTKLSDIMGSGASAITIDIDPKTGKVKFIDSVGTGGASNGADGVNDWMHDVIGYRPK